MLSPSGRTYDGLFVVTVPFMLVTALTAGTDKPCPLGTAAF